MQAQGSLHIVYDENEEEAAYLLSNYHGDIWQYIVFLHNYYREAYRFYCDGAYDSMYDYFMNREVCRAYNLLPHDYLAGEISEETGEVSIRGLRLLCYDEDSSEYGPLFLDGSHVDSDCFIIPDEIDGRPVTEIQAGAFDPDGLASYLNCVIIGRNVREMGGAFREQNTLTTMIVLSKNAAIRYQEYLKDVYCYTGSKAEDDAKEYNYSLHCIDGDSLLWDGETIAGSVLPVRFGMTEAELRSHLSVDGASSEIQIDGLQDGKVTGGTTVTLFHTVAQAPGKVYTVEKKAEPIRVSVETLPTKTNYFYKETFDPSGLSLRVAYDDGTETVVTDGITCTGTDLTVGTNTITATYENQSVTFPVTVRYSWWQTLIRIFLFGFLWY